MVRNGESVSPRKPQKLLKSITCPHCWHRFQTADIAWVARHEDLRGDPILGTDAFLRFLPTRFNVKCEAMDARGMPCQALACPRCHLTIARMFLRYEPLTFSLIGVPSSGKSYFLTAMTWELARMLPTQFSLVFNDVDPFSNLTLKEYQSTLFLASDRTVPVAIAKTQTDANSHYNATMLDGQHTLQPRPFLFSMRPLREHPRAAESEDLTRILCLFDNAGEYFLPSSDAVVSPSTLHMSHSKVLLFLYDPTLDPRFREKCMPLSNDPQLRECSITFLQSTALTDAASRIRQHAHLPADRRLEQPLLVLVTKSDIWANLLGEDISSEPLIKPDPPYRKLAALDGKRIHRVSRALRKLMVELAPEFVGAAEDACREVVYIPVSGLGCSPCLSEKGGKSLLVQPERIHPRWVTTPILYAFARYSSGLMGAVWQ